MTTKTYSQDLSGRNSFGMKLSCRCFIEYDSISDIFDMDFDGMFKPVRHIGSGSNILFTEDFKGTILHSAVKFIEPLEDSLISVGSGVKFDDFCKWTAEKGIWGPENLSAIPGEVGAAAVQNIGAYGVEVSELIKTVYCYDIVEEEMVHFDVTECGYAYRNSMFKHAGNRFIVTHVLFDLSKFSGPRLGYAGLGSLLEQQEITPMSVRKAIKALRSLKLPDVVEYGSAGSFFKNPVVSRDTYERVAKLSCVEVPHYDLPDSKVKIPAAFLIEQCGWKGRRSGNVAVWEKQPLVIVNLTGRAVPDEVIAMENKIRVSVREKFGIELEAEVEHI